MSLENLKGQIINAMRPRISLQVKDLEMTSGVKHVNNSDKAIQGKLIFQQNNLFFQEDGKGAAQEIKKNKEVYDKILGQLQQKGGRRKMTRRQKSKRVKKTKTRKH